MWELVANIVVILDLPDPSSASLIATWKPVNTLNECLELANSVAEQFHNKHLESISCNYKDW